MDKKIIVSFLWLFLAAIPSTQSFAQEDESNALDFIPPSQFVSGWEASGHEILAPPMRATWLLADDLDLLLEFDLQWYATETYTQGEDEMVVEIFEFKSTSDAFGFYNLSYIELPDPEAIEVEPPYGNPPLSNIETIRRVTYNNSEYLEAYQDKYYVRVKTKSEYLTVSGTKAALWILGRIPGFPGKADLLGILPTDNLVVGTERYILGPVGLDRIMPTNGYDLFGNNEYDWKAAAAEYRIGSGEYYLMVGVEYDDTDTAEAMVGSVSDYFTDGRYEPVLVRPFESGIIPHGYSGDNYLVIWSDGNYLWLIWDASDLDSLLAALGQQ